MRSFAMTNSILKLLLLSLAYVCIPDDLFSLEYLTQEQMNAFQRDGFLVIEDFVPPEECDYLRSRALDLVEQDGPAAAHQVFTCDNSKSRDLFFLEISFKNLFLFRAKSF